ncbi:hypothetical protein [Burkholderia cepacia]|uniref:hypothetical protein n=1 Tax=Burkholderia cepacia TaxID=292 RepID=UPI000F5AB04B|nr:hypothetical protein [Burkholderia cepacia]
MKILPSKGLLYATVSVGVMWASAATAECRIAQTSVVMCRDPRLAVDAYQEFGRDTEAMKASYNRARLHQARCFVVTDPGRVWTFKQLSSGRVATAAGWINVMQVNRPHDGLDDIRFVAAGYLTGTCKPQD